jgi:Protein of unknown function (DUF2917)
LFYRRTISRGGDTICPLAAQYKQQNKQQNKFKPLGAIIMLKAEKLNHLPISREAFITAKIIRLAPREALTLKQKGQSIRIHNGRVWITLDGYDHFVGCGKLFNLGHGKAKAVISSANKYPIQIQIEEV